MLPVRNGLRSTVTSPSYICLQCRLNSTLQASQGGPESTPKHLVDSQGDEQYSVGIKTPIRHKKRSSNETNYAASSTGPQSRWNAIHPVAVTDREQQLLDAREQSLKEPSDELVSQSLSEVQATQNSSDSLQIDSTAATYDRPKRTRNGKLREADLRRLYPRKKGELVHKFAAGGKPWGWKKVSDDFVGVREGLSGDTFKRSSVTSKSKVKLHLHPTTKGREHGDDPEAPGYFDMVADARKDHIDVVAYVRKDTRPVVPRKQYGTPMFAKEKEALDQSRMEGVLDVLDAHKASVEGREVDRERVHGLLGGAKLPRRKDGVYRPFEGTGGENAIRQQAIASYVVRDNVFGDKKTSHPRAKSERSDHSTSSHRDIQRLHPSPSASLSVRQKRPGRIIPSSGPQGSHQLRLLHTSRRTQQQAAAAALETFDFPPPPPVRRSVMNSDIRMQLRKWQELHANSEEDAQNQQTFDQDPDVGDGATNTLTRLPDAAASLRRLDQEEEEQRQALAHFTKDHDGTTEDTGSAADHRFLQVGDLVELEFPKSERESIIAVFVRRLAQDCQLFTMNGKWVHVPERQIQYSIPGWVSKDLVEPLLDHIPQPATQQEFERLRELSFVEDISVPRSVSAPLVSRMVQFHTESLEIYRKFAGTLDDAHNILAHDTDLRYGSLLSAATTLLQMPADKLPVTALFTVRSALGRAGFAFNIDRRSHRLTGYLQIRSKEQVKMVDYVRNWLRDWQDDMATRSALEAQGNERGLRKHRTAKGAQHVYSFLEKARNIVHKSREDREATLSGNIGPSKKSFPITPTSDCVKMTTDTQFSEQDTELVRFLEAWCCSNMFMGLPRLQALPPLLLHATGLYPQHPLDQATGFLFLQELGTIMPYENRVRFDQHLLLPSSQHSKPLQNLMSSLLDMQNKHNFSDSMRDLRHDWGRLPVYCIDDASAHEIDDGLSIEKAGDGEWWVHVHIANPTAFFERDHPLAKMARHMGESIYMPERTYMMLPRWATARHFSLGSDRPCLTISTRMDGEGTALEKKIRSGTIRNVYRVTPAEVRTLLQAEHTARKERVLTVGGDVPPPRSRKSALPQLDGKMVEELDTLRHLAEKRSAIRQATGGVFFDMHNNDIQVWQGYKSTGLAWDHPHRRGARTVEGDPIVQMRTQGLQNWFTPQNNAADVLVREMMLLACETAASWSAERQIPVIFRGTVQRPDDIDPDKYFHDVIQPAVDASPTGEMPMHLSIQYVQALGRTVLRTTPVKHKVAGMEHYAKVTSPLRRYGDMIVHWQIEAALREEARTGRSLVTKEKRTDYSFLPFSPNVLDTIMLGLQPREFLISRAKMYANQFWISMLMFRAHHFGECELPFATTQQEAAHTGKPLIRVFIHTDQMLNQMLVAGIETLLNVSASMYRPERFGMDMAKRGDVWECEMDFVDVYKRIMLVKPIRLVERPMA